MWNILLIFLAGVLPAAFIQTTDAKSLAKQQYEALLEEAEELRAQFSESFEHARSTEEKNAAQRQYTMRLKALSLRAVSLARAYPNDPVAIDALAWTLRSQQVPETGQALELLGRDYADKDQLADACKYASNFFGRPDSMQAERFLREVLAKNTNARVRGNACFDLAQFLVDRAKHLRWLRRHPEIVEGLAHNFGTEQTQRFMTADADVMLKEADALFSRVIGEFASLTNKSGGTPLGEQSSARLFRLRNLSVGCNVPEIDGCDVDGQRFRLGDYRGKVVLLTFCGNWCPSCRALYPKERELIGRLAGEPFVLLSVNNDENQETLRQSIMSGEITWRCWWDGHNGPLSRKWGIWYYPTIFIIDASGKIRYEDIPAPELDGAVETLLNEMKR